MKLLERVIPDVQTALFVPERGTAIADQPFDLDAAAPGGLWDPETGEVEGGIAHPADSDLKEDDSGGDGS